MKKTFKTNNEIMSMEELVEKFVLDLYETQTLELNLDSIMDLINNDRLLTDDFAFNYAISQSQSDIVFIEKNPKGEMDVKSEFIILAEDAIKFDEFLDMIYEGRSMKDAESQIRDLNSTRKKVAVANKAQMQLELYYLATDYIEVINTKIKSVKQLYLLMNK